MDLFIIRGIPGSGKTTLAYKIAEIVREADQFFIDENGEYKFNKDEISRAHEFCRHKVRIDMACGVSRIAVSNTFVKRWEMQIYLDLALEFNYTVTEITVNGGFVSKHNVPDETIARMKANWKN